MTTEQFNSLSKVKQRILVAKDVIAQLKLKKFKATKGHYVRIKDFALRSKVEDKKDLQLNEQLPNIKQCEVCARGAMFMSTVKLGNNFSINQMYIPWGGAGESNIAEIKLANRLDSVFAPDQQYLIEMAFEGRDINDQLREVLVWGVQASTKFGIFDTAYKLIAAKAKAFYKRYQKNDNRMIGIMKNVIKNKGKFVI